MRHSRGKFDAVASAQAAPARGVGFVVRCGESLRRACSLPPGCRAATTGGASDRDAPLPPSWRPAPLPLARAQDAYGAATVGTPTPLRSAAVSSSLAVASPSRRRRRHLIFPFYVLPFFSRGRRRPARPCEAAGRGQFRAPPRPVARNPIFSASEGRIQRGTHGRGTPPALRMIRPAVCVCVWWWGSPGTRSDSGSSAGSAPDASRKYFRDAHTGVGFLKKWMTWERTRWNSGWTGSSSPNKRGRAHSPQSRTSPLRNGIGLKWT